MKSARVLGRAFQAARSVLDRMSRAAMKPCFEACRCGSTRGENRRTNRPLRPHSTIRIEQNKLDRLMRVVGELLVARGVVSAARQKLNNGADGAAVVKDLKEAGSNISRIADELQTSVMSIRMLPVKTVFQRFPRLVRDLARSLGKEVRLVIEGRGNRTGQDHPRANRRSAGARDPQCGRPWH